ncbi:unnamed protein product [Ilex paraguariensis]|uniref:Agenet domain-containing protein n=1 Tax=Ilex paraguariensis TaxID=185542 RepID=A0ABC8TUR1_9AQUA
MDYDDNDFQGQNLHLAGEGSSNFSPVLRPYALPKFDFDDSLQGHLRFDSLVENEVFLGIPSQEDNHWIEDFSRGSSGIEFSPSAAESCSISRRKNVWSEATSSETVEMLLKSVGQEDMVPGETIIEEADAVDELGSLPKEMEPNLKQDDRIDEVTDSQPAVPPDEFAENFSGLTQSARCERPVVECTSLTQEAELSAYGSSSELDPNAVSEKGGSFVIQENLGIDRTCNDAKLTNVDILVTKSLVSTTQEDSGMQINNVDSSLDNVVGSTAELSDQEIPHQVSGTTFENTKDLLKDTDKGVEEDSVASKASNMGDPSLRGTVVESCTYNLDSPVCVASKVECGEDHALGTGITNLEDPSNLVTKGSDALKTAEACNEDVCPTNPDEGIECKVIVHSEGKEVSQQESLFGSDSQMNRGASVGGPEAVLLPVVENEPFRQGDGSSANRLGDLASFTAACSLGEVLKGKSGFENSKGGNDASGVHQKDLNSVDSDLSPVLDESIQMYKENAFSEQDEARNNDRAAPSHENMNAKVSVEPSYVKCEIIGSLDIDKTVGSLSTGKCIRKDVFNSDVFEFDNMSEKRPALEDTCSASCGILDDVSLLSGNGSSANEVIDHSKEQKSTISVVGLAQLDKKEEMEVEVPTEASLSDLKECSQVARKLGSVSKGLLFEFEKGSSHDCAAQMLSETADQSVSLVEACGTESHSEKAVVAEEVNQVCSEALEVEPVPCEPSVKEGDVPEAVAIKQHNEMTEKGHKVAPLYAADASADHQVPSDLDRPSECGANRMLEDGGSSAESDKPSCDSPTAFSFTELSQSEKNKQEGLKGVVAEKTGVVSLNQKENDSSREERGFTFEVSPAVHISEGETGKIVEGSPLTSAAGKMDPKMVQEISCGSPQALDEGIVSGSAKDTSERKRRRATGKASAKGNSKRGNNANEITLVRLSERGTKSSNRSKSPSGTSQLVQFEELKSYGNLEHSGPKPSVVISIPTCNLPDLNTSAPSSALFQQPFTDLQQVQLRAQIFVYGSLIQGAAPDEACMISAFGPSEGGRSLWDPAWCACVERLNGQKSHANNSEPPVQSHSGARVPDQPTKQSSLQNKSLSSSIGRASSKASPPTVVNPVIPLSSPLWNVSTPYSEGLQSSRGMLFDYHQPLSPLHPFQTAPIRNLAGHNSWISQAPFPGPWATSPQTSAFDYSARFSALPFTETVKLTPVKDSGIKHVAPFSVAQTGNPSVLSGTSSPQEVKKVTVSPGQPSTEPKTRKRKKASVSENLGQISLLAQTRSELMSTPVASKKVSVCEGTGQISLLAQTQTESVCAPFVTGHFSTAVAVTASSCFASKSSSSKCLIAASPTSSTDHPKKEDQNLEKRVTISEETFTEVEKAKLQAEDAAAYAATAVSQCKGVWNQLDNQKNSGMISDVEAKLSSAAVAIAAAASVAKAAAAAAKIASNAAAQAKLMADEALAPSGTGNAVQSNAMSHLNVVKNFGTATPVSILKSGDESTSSSSIIVAAREAARRRVEAASTASRHAENLDAIVKAAELAAAAVSQAGAIVAMGDPLPLRELVEAGPEGYWKVPQVSFDQAVKSNNAYRDQANVNIAEEGPSMYARQPFNQGMQTTNPGMPPRPKEVSRDLMESNVRLVDGISGSVTSGQRDSRGQRAHRASTLAKTIGVVPESESGLGSTSVSVEDEFENVTGTLKDNIIREGCLVEVVKVGGDGKLAWFPANVLSLKDGKAFVCYTELHSDEGSGKLKEWVPLEGDGKKSPGIRIPHTMTSVRVDGTRKRRRAPARDYSWSIGDRVDVLMQNCWREGVVTEKNEKDETTLTVHFPVEGETSVVRVWHLRPSLVWKDGEWIDWSILREHCSAQGDTPQEKRLKLGSPVVEGKAKDKMLKNMDLEESEKHEESRLLPLANNEKIFNVGMNTRDENKPGAPRTMRSGLQKEGSRVIFGVPKPGKKKKFMEVSKHYVTDRGNKNNLANDSVKLAKYLMPQGSGSRGWKNSSKIDAKEKQAAEFRPKVLKSGRPLGVSGRTLPQKDNILATQVSAPNNATITDVIVKDAISNEESESGQQNLREFRSFSSTEEATEGPILFSSAALPPDAPFKKVSTSNAKSERQNKGNLAPGGGKSGKVEAKDKLVPEVAEPRRSNRRIQPTSRLLEGLQSSLIISKIPAASHDRSQKSQNRGTSKGNSHD